MKIKHIPDCSVVKTNNRIGVLMKQTGGKPQIHFGDIATEISDSAEVEVVKYPAQLAKEFVSALLAEEAAINWKAPLFYKTTLL